MEGELDEMKSAGEDNKRAADAAKESADATRDSVNLSKDTAMRQLRAYVFIQDVNIFLLENDTVIDVTVKFLNSGQTPGYDLRTSFKAEIKAPPTIGSPYSDLAPPESKSII